LADFEDVLDNLGGKHLAGYCWWKKRVLELLEIMDGQRLQTKGTEPRLYRESPGCVDSWSLAEVISESGNFASKT
jgi:hypothetical protein